eukprot:gnl/Chilomastix_cuspidata/1096.p1 GENE.gnl/Chilomastix_cuspidata/1096~~gnl/Chilomastix_cuspidata/1096.p1  ORF type:complete len:525 (+),score=200.13 gnl/Chilomastix_cuspidata/1096:1572-3146(+)
MHNGFFPAFSFGVNYILGIGVLSVPHIFSKGGTLLSPITFLLIAFLSATQMVEIVEITARGIEVLRHRERGEDLSSSRDSELGSAQSAPARAAAAPPSSLSPSPSESTSLTDEGLEEQRLLRNECEADQGPRFIYSDTRILEVSDLMKLFTGRVGQGIFLACLLVFVFLYLWDYGCVFAESATLVIPIPGITQSEQCAWGDGTDWTSDCETSYTIWALVFLVIATVLTLLEPDEQFYLQVVFTALRFLVIIIVIVTTLIAMFQGPYVPKGGDASDAATEPPYVFDVPLFDWENFGELFTTAIFSYVIHFSVPVLLGVLGAENHRMAVPYVYIVTFTIAIFYCVVGIVASEYFGDSANIVITTMWADYNGSTFNGGDRPWWAAVLAYIVQVFPVLDLCSAFPLSALVLGNNLRNVFCSEAAAARTKYKVIFRLIAAMPPIILSYFIRDIEMLLEVSGCFAFFVAFFGPSWAVIEARRMCKKIWGERGVKTPFDFVLTKNIGVFIIFGVSVVLFILTIYIYASGSA